MSSVENWLPAGILVVQLQHNYQIIYSTSSITQAQNPLYKKGFPFQDDVQKLFRSFFI